MKNLNVVSIVNEFLFTSLLFGFRKTSFNSNLNFLTAKFPIFQSLS